MAHTARRSSGVLLALGAAVVIALGFVAVVAASSSHTRSAPSNPYPASSSRAATQPTPQPSQEASGYPDVEVAEGKHCKTFDDGPFGQVGTASKTTSCPFAINVHAAYVSAGIEGGDGTVEAYSPVTNEHYTLTCTGSQPALCTGGVAARVIIFGGQLVVDSP